MTRIFGREINWHINIGYTDSAILLSLFRPHCMEGARRSMKSYASHRIFWRGGYPRKRSDIGWHSVVRESKQLMTIPPTDQMRKYKDGNNFAPTVKGAVPRGSDG